MMYGISEAKWYFGSYLLTKKVMIRKKPKVLYTPRTNRFLKRNKKGEKMIWKSSKRKILENKIRLSKKIVAMYDEEKLILRALKEKEKPKEETYHKGKAHAFSEVLKVIGE